MYPTCTDSLTFDTWWVANVPDGDDFSESPGKILRDNVATLEEIKIDEVGYRALRRSVPNGNVLLYMRFCR